MAGNLEQFDAHGALPEDLAHEIFETIHHAIRNNSNHSYEEIHRAANEASRAIQASVANHMATIQWKMLNRRILRSDQR